MSKQLGVVSRHVVLRRPDGSIRLILPTANAAVLRSVLGMYFPSRLLGKIYRAALERVMPLQARLGWCEDAGDTKAWCPGLDEALCVVPAAQAQYVGALISEPGPQSKLTLKVMAADGTALAYGRIGYTPAAIFAIQQESAVLRVLAQMPLARQVPQLLGAGDLAGQSGAYLIETAGPDLEAGPALTAAHFEFLAGLATGKTQSWADVVAALEQEFAEVLTAPALSEPVQQALHYLKSANLGDLPVVIEHGDFAPWNLRLNKIGQIYALDWEHSKIKGLPWMDALHFVFQYTKLVLQADASTILQAMREVFSNPSNNGITKNYRDSMILLFLMKDKSLNRIPLLNLALQN